MQIRRLLLSPENIDFEIYDDMMPVVGRAGRVCIDSCAEYIISENAGRIMGDNAVAAHRQRDL